MSAEHERGVRHNEGKTPWHLVPWDGLYHVVRVFAFGARKYTDRNWEKGLSFEQTFASLMRHLLAWYGGVSRDHETGELHLAHATWNALVLLTFTVRGRDDLDDRPCGYALAVQSEPECKPEPECEICKGTGCDPAYKNVLCPACHKSEPECLYCKTANLDPDRADHG